MYHTLSQLDPNLLSLTGVIATILAVIFALGAFNNSRTRKKHMMELEKSQRQEQAMHFRPTKSHLPSRSASPSRSSSPAKSSSPRSSTPPAGPRAAPRAAPVAKASTPPEETIEKKASDTPVLFRKVRLDGGDDFVDSVKEEDQELYVWE